MRAPKTIKLAMTILVRNEGDVIEHNIRFHAANGVDCFVVMDNGSSDGTREILQRLSAEYQLHIIDQPEQNYQQAKWMTELAFYARDKLQADIVISNDADEFWVPENNTSLKDHFKSSDSVVTVQRKNMVLTHDSLRSDYHFTDSTRVVKNPICYNDRSQLNEELVSMLLVKISPKAVTNPYGLIRIKGGNHRAKHVWRRVNSRTEEAITVYHYPIRGYKQFEENIINRQRLLETTNASMGKHYKRWVSLYSAGKLKEEYEKIILSDKDLETTDKLGITMVDTHTGSLIRSAYNQHHQSE